MEHNHCTTKESRYNYYGGSSKWHKFRGDFFDEISMDEYKFYDSDVAEVLDRETVIASLRHAFRGHAWNLSPSSFNQLTTPRLCKNRPGEGNPWRRTISIQRVIVFTKITLYNFETIMRIRDICSNKNRQTCAVAAFFGMEAANTFVSTPKKRLKILKFLVRVGS